MNLGHWYADLGMVTGFQMPSSGESVERCFRRIKPEATKLGGKRAGKSPNQRRQSESSLEQQLFLKTAHSDSWGHSKNFWGISLLLPPPSQLLGQQRVLDSLGLCLVILAESSETGQGGMAVQGNLAFYCLENRK